jgi:ethanolamine ammonia-lyase small subunit
VPTQDHLQFQLDHALARDAVHAELDVALLQHGLQARGLESIALQSAASATANHPAARGTYLRRPDLGRALHANSIAALKQRITPSPEIILADGLSSLAVERHALPLLDATLGLLDPGPWTLTPVVTNARVAIGDEIGQLLQARLTVMLIGERPGLSSPDSLGCYITWDPRPGRTDAERNCISNIRGDAGLSYAAAAQRIGHYLAEATRRGTTGTALKDPVFNDSGSGWLAQRA